jgi:hypothetical protein
VNHLSDMLFYVLFLGRLSGVMVRVLATWAKVQPTWWLSKGNKNPQHTIFQRESKAGGPMS